MPEARSAVVNESYAMTPQDAKANRERKRKMEMSKLRTQFFGRGDTEEHPRKKNVTPVSETREPETNPPKYIDRAKLRRQTNGPRAALLASARPTRPEPSPPVANTVKEDPFGAGSRGAALLAKVGGTTRTSMTMGSLVEARTMGVSQAGLGSRALVVGVEEVARASSGGTDWREQAREASRKRYHAL